MGYAHDFNAIGFLFEENYIISLCNASHAEQQSMAPFSNSRIFGEERTAFL
jgi:hypothetical protein